MRHSKAILIIFGSLHAAFPSLAAFFPFRMKFTYFPSKLRQKRGLHLQPDWEKEGETRVEGRSVGWFAPDSVVDTQAHALVRTPANTKISSIDVRNFDRLILG